MNDAEDPCPGCFDTPLYPLQLPCNHVYCFLCAKDLCESGISQSKCAICRQLFPREIIENKPLQLAHFKDTMKRSITWFYEGKNGWWDFDERSAEAIEEAFVVAPRITLQILLCGKLYAIDFKRMVQYRVDGSGRVRSIKRGNPDPFSRGVAGLGRVSQQK